MERISKLTKRKVKTLLFDLDNTLYSPTCGLLPEVGRRITLFTVEQFGIGEEEAFKLQKHYWRKYGSSLVGYVYDEGVDPKKYQDFVYDIEYPKFINRDTDLIDLFKRLDYRKIVYTNGAVKHAKAVLKSMGLEDAFDQIVGIENVRWFAKPMIQSYREMLIYTGIHPSETVFFEDAARNLAAARRFGMGTVLIGEGDGSSEHENPYEMCDLRLESVKEIKL